MSSTSIKASTLVQDIVKIEKEVADITFLKQGLYYYHGSIKHQKELYYFGVEKHLMGPSGALIFPVLILIFHLATLRKNLQIGRLVALNI